MTEDNLTSALATYRPSKAVTELVRQANLILLVGISGAGKDTLKQELLKKPRYYNFISHTTRAPRSNQGVMERDGEDYFFITKDEAVRMLNDGEFIEAKQYSDNVYGTTAEGLRQSIDGSVIAVNDVEVQGVEEYMDMSSGGNIKPLFILPPSYEEWQQRLTGRYAAGAIDPDDMSRRLVTARMELEFALNREYFTFVINDTIDDAVAQVDTIVTGGRQARQADARQRAHTLLAAISTH